MEYCCTRNLLNQEQPSLPRAIRKVRHGTFQRLSTSLDPTIWSWSWPLSWWQLELFRSPNNLIISNPSSKDGNHLHLQAARLHPMIRTKPSQAFTLANAMTSFSWGHGAISILACIVITICTALHRTCYAKEITPSHVHTIQGLVVKL